MDFLASSPNNNNNKNTEPGIYWIYVNLLAPLNRNLKVSLKESPKFHLEGLYICVDFSFRNLKKERKETTINDIS